MDYNNKKGALLVLSVALLVFVLIVVSKYARNSAVPENQLGNGENLEKEYLLVEDSFNGNNLSDAISRAESIVNNNGNDIEALLLLGTSYLQKGSLEFREKEYGEKGLEIADKILALDKNSDRAYIIRGYAYEIMEDFDKSIEAYNKGIEINSENVSLYNHRGHAFFLMGNIVKATMDVNRALKIDPNDYFALVTKSKYLLDGKDRSKRDIEEAEQMLNKALEVESEINLRMKAEIYQLLGFIKLTNGDYNGAKIEFQKSVEIDKSLVGAWTGLADATYFSLEESVGNNDEFGEKFLEALGYTQSAIDLYENCSSAYMIMAKIMHLNEDNDEIVKNILEQAEEIVEKDIILNINQKEKVKSDIANYRNEWNLN